MCDPGSESRLGGREKKGGDNKWTGKKVPGMYEVGVFLFVGLCLFFHLVSYHFGPSFLSSPYIIIVVTQIRATYVYARLFFPLSTTVRAFALVSREYFKADSSLVESR